jgi:hypothetical protein
MADQAEHPHRTLRQRWATTTLSNQWTAVATVVIAFATVVNLIVAAAMWREMHKGGADTHDLALAAKSQASNTENLAKSSVEQVGKLREEVEQLKRSADETHAMADTARKSLAIGEMNTAKQLSIATAQVEVTQRQLEASRRPYVGVASVVYTPDLSQNKITITPRFINVGPSPAENVSLKYRLWVNDVEQPYDQPPITGILFPQTARGPDIELTNVDFQRLNRGGMTLVLEVSSTYYWATKKYEYCELWDFAWPIREFVTVGSCPDDKAKH